MIREIYKYINYLSLDVAIGAAVLSSSISKYFNGMVDWTVSSCLGLAVWVIYTFDHLLDAHKSKEGPTIGRHLFHKKYSKTLSIVAISLTILGIWLLVDLPEKIIKHGVVLSGSVLIYFLFVISFRRFYMKEVFVAIVYSIGVFLGPTALMKTYDTFMLMSFFLQLLLIAFLNLTIFSWIEYKLDLKDDHPSLVRKIGRQKMTILIRAVFMVLVLSQLILLNLSLSTFQFSFLLMVIMLYMVFYFKENLLEHEHYRWLGDAIFFIPSIELLI